ncbi:baseplate J/gp47 family protein [uncultured Cellulomonas sp.]|uniref:baseplate J/gp47 family protein n=1 Tax=uncultured Cellulomonas sp. TaxID=189682 RepID=UPI00261E209C|nr:baseplate J/gp47 family protein [uncultured Cellulomonas sp.]
MSRTPQQHRARHHTEVLAGMEADARDRFADAARRWVPRPTAAGEDPGQGLLDCVAAAVDVLWSYEHAWADECFLPTAQLPQSQARLLDLVGHRPRPPLSATGLQQLRLAAGTAATIPAGFAVGAPASAGAGPAVFETAVALRADARLNELQPFATLVAPARELPPAVAAVAPPPLHLPGASLAEQLASRVDAAQRGAAAARDAARARSDALALADLATTLRGAGDPSCPEAFAALCDTLCERAHALVDAEAAAAARPLEPLTEAQRLVMGSLARVDAALPTALASLDTALGRHNGEDDAAYAGRLDAMAQFLDALVEGILAQARDDIVRLRGPRALTVLDRTLARGARPGELGVATPGTDRFYLLPAPAAPPPAGPVSHAGLLRPGDWLVLADVVEVPTGDGGTTRRSEPREAVRVVRADDLVAPLLGERATQVVVSPPLRRWYDLARTVVLGNVVPVSHGRTVRRTVTGPGPWPVEGEPLAFLPDPAAPEGRRPAVELAVGGQAWELTGEVVDTATGTRAFTVDVLADGGTVVRTGDAASGAAVPPGLAALLTTRVGTGAAGNRPAGAVDGVLAPVPQVVATRNVLPTSGGADAEDPAVARRRATASVQTLDRAVTARDVGALLEGHGLVSRVHVGHDDVDRPRHLRIVVSGPGGRTLTPDEHGVVTGFLAARVPPGLVVRTVDRRLVRLRAVVTVAVDPAADPLLVTAQVRARLGAEAPDVADAPAGAPPPTSPVPGLLDPGAVDLGQSVNVSDLHRALAGTPGVRWVVVDALHRADEPVRRAERVVVPSDAEPRWAPDEDGAEGLTVRWEEARDR